MTYLLEKDCPLRGRRQDDPGASTERGGLANRTKHALVKVTGRFFQGT